MILLAVVGAISFVLGVAVGLTLKEAWMIAHGRHTDTMTAIGRTLDRALRAPSARYVGLALVVLSLSANALVGFLSITTAADQDEDRAARDRLVDCFARYNYLDGRARDERAAQAQDERTSSIVLWSTLREELTRDGGTDPRSGIVPAIDRYVADLRSLDATVEANPYPRPDLCGGVPTMPKPIRSEIGEEPTP